MRTLRALACVLTFAACGPTEEPSMQAGLDEYGTVSQDLVVCATGPTVQGLDVSVYQGTINWPQVHAAGKEFAIARIGDGLGHDGTFAGHWAGIKAAGMIRGAYQFFRPMLDPIAQADIVIAAVGRLGPGDLPVVCDVEATGTLPSTAVYNTRLHQWADRVEAGTGKRPIIYVGKYYWANVNTADFAGYPLWHPQYTTASCPNISNFWGNWKLWQYRGGPVSGIPGGTCPGISGYVDLNVFNGSLADLRVFAGQQTCQPHCEGTVMVGADCGRGDCGAYGLSCANDSLGLRCVFNQCPAIGEKDVCLDDQRVAHCKDGILGTPGDCSAYAGRCSTANAPTGARCVSAFCASSMTAQPQPGVGCWPQSPARIARCDANGMFTTTPCGAGEQCSVIGGAHCEPKFCPPTGTVDVCTGDSLAHCVEGQVVSAVDCGAKSSTCSAVGGAARCVAKACADDVAHAHRVCLPTGWLASCDADGQVSSGAPCAMGSSCNEANGDAACVAAAHGVDAGTPAMGGADAGTPMAGEGPVEEVDAGVITLEPAPLAPVDGSGCSTGSSVLVALVGVLTLTRTRRRRS
jgi:lysozyme